MAAIVVNKRTHTPTPDDVYVGRPSIWGNPYPITRTLSRAQAIARFRRYLETRPDLVERAKRELTGKILVCWCKPHVCHGDVLAELVNDVTPNEKRCPCE